MGHSAVPSTAWGRAVDAAPGWARGDRRWPDKRRYQAAPRPRRRAGACQAAPLAARSPPTGRPPDAPATLTPDARAAWRAHVDLAAVGPAAAAASRTRVAALADAITRGPLAADRPRVTLRRGRPRRGVAAHAAIARIATTTPTTITTTSSLVVPVPMDQPPSICASPRRSAAGGKTDHQVWISWTLVPPYRLDLVAFRWAS